MYKYFIVYETEDIKGNGIIELENKIQPDDIIVLEEDIEKQLNVEEVVITNFILFE